MAVLRDSPPPLDWGVTVTREGVTNLAERWRRRPFPDPAFDYRGLPPWRGPRWADFCVLSVSVIACLWPPEGEKMWRAQLDGTWLDDAPGLFACFTRDPSFSVNRFIGFASHDAATFFQGKGTLQLLDQRAEQLAAVAGALNDRWEGSAMSLVEEAGRDGPRLVELLVDTIPGYRDRVETAWGTLAFDKLAYLCATMINTRSPVPLSRLDSFPVYPDYMLPRIMRHYGILIYEPELASAVDKRQLIPAGSEWELAIRWATVYAADRIADALAQVGNPAKVPSLDYTLWRDSVLGPEAAAMGEHHRTVTMAY